MLDEKTRLHKNRQRAQVEDGYGHMHIDTLFITFVRKYKNIANNTLLWTKAAFL